MTSVRLAAARALMAVDRRESTLGGALEFARKPLDSARDRALLVEITTGSLRWRNELDAVISAASRRDIAQIDPKALVVLRLGAYQLRHLDRIPEHAVVHESVETTKSLGAPKAAGFVNAVLRSLIRRGNSMPLPKRPASDASRAARLAYLSVTLSHPEWLVSRWLDRMGFEATETWCRFNNTAPDVTIRSIGRMTAKELAARLEADEIRFSPAPFVSDAWRLDPGSLGRLSPELRSEVWVQDEGAQLIARSAGVRPGERVLDVCAAPGGKSLVLAEDLALRTTTESLLVSSDRRHSRVTLLTRTLTDAGLHVPVLRLEARHPLPFLSAFDCVVVDAPCSGLGTLRREPDLKWTRAETDLAPLAADELRILCSSAEAVRPGGRLIYATCSSEPEENTGVVASFLEKDGRFRQERVISPVASRPVVDEDGNLATRPDVHGLEAFFAAVLVRREGT